MRQIYEGKGEEKPHTKATKDHSGFLTLWTFVPVVWGLFRSRWGNFTVKGISVLHDFAAVAKTARAAIPRDEFEGARSFRNSRTPPVLRLKNTQAPQLYFP
jgi:hypothetical protein